MQQQVNLYLGLPKVAKQFLYAKQIAQICGIFIGFLFLISIFQGIGNSFYTSRATTLQTKLEIVSKKLAEVTARYPRVSKENQLRAEMQQLHQQINANNRILQTVS